MGLFRSLSVVIAVCMVASCSSPRIDGSSAKAYESSLAAVRESLPAGDREAFDEAVMVVALGNVEGGLLGLAALGADGAGAKARASLDGKTGAEILAAADAIRAELEAEQRKQALQEIAELRERRDAADRAAAELEAFEVLRSRYAKRDAGFGTTEPLIELTVRNGTEQAVSRAYFVGTLASPGRSVPWVKEAFNYSIPGGLEPGEDATWRLAPNMFSEWGTVDAPSDAVLTVDVVRLDGADDSTMFDASAFSERDQERLAELEAEYGND